MERGGILSHREKKNSNNNNSGVFEKQANPTGRRSCPSHARNGMSSFSNGVNHRHQNSKARASPEHSARGHNIVDGGVVVQVF